jgi:hypothetical protein
MSVFFIELQELVERKAIMNAESDSARKRDHHTPQSRFQQDYLIGGRQKRRYRIWAVS